MFSSMNIGRYFGIDFFIHPTFWLLPLFVLFSGGAVDAMVFNLAVLGGVFGCVALHEVGHALAARSYGIRTRDITLYPIGGVARLEAMPRTPWREIAVALAGPAVNLVIAVAIILGMTVSNIALPSRMSAHDLSWGQEYLLALAGINIGLLLFNLIPAFPMDGGRVLRAVLAMPMGRLKATEMASTIGSVFAVLFFFAGLGLLDGVLDAIGMNGGFSPMLMVLAVFLFFAGKAELMAVRYEAAKERMGSMFGSRNYNAQEGNAEQDDYTGWTFDPDRRVWTQWRNGVAVAEHSAV